MGRAQEVVPISEISWKCFPIQHWKFLVNYSDRNFRANGKCLVPASEIASSYLLCTSRKYPYSPQQKGLAFPGRGGLCKTQKFKEICETLLEFPVGWGVLKNPFHGGGTCVYRYFLELHI